MNRTRNHPQDKEAGLALPATVWFVMIFFLILSAVMNLAMGQKYQASAYLTQAKMELAAEAAISQEIKNLLDSDSEQQTQPLALNGFSVAVLSTNEAGKVNLNLADQDLLSGLFAEYGFSNAAAVNLTHVIVDARENQGPFESVDRLLAFEGIAFKKFSEIRDDITIHSPSPRVNPDHASERVLKVLARLGEEFTQSTQSILKPKEFETGQVWRIVATAQDQTGRKLTMEKIIRLTGIIYHPYIVHSSRIGF